MKINIFRGEWRDPSAFKTTGALQWQRVCSNALFTSPRACFNLLCKQKKIRIWAPNAHIYHSNLCRTWASEDLLSRIVWDNFAPFVLWSCVCIHLYTKTAYFLERLNNMPARKTCPTDAFQTSRSAAANLWQHHQQWFCFDQYIG